MKLANAVEKIEELARESERQKIKIEQLSESLYNLKEENKRLKQELEQQNK